MKNKSFSLAITMIIALALSSFFIGCPDEEGPPPPSKEAQLLEISVAGIDLTIPTAIPKDTWEDLEITLASLPVDTRGELRFNLQEQMDNNPVIIAKVSNKATVEYAIATTATRPENWSDGTELVYQTGRFLNVKVTSEDGNNENYYRFSITRNDPATTITSITVASVSATLGTPAGETWSTATAGNVVVSMSAISGSVAVTAQKPQHSTVRFAVAASLTAEPVFTGEGIGAGAGNATGSLTGVTDGSYIYVEATAQNGVDKAYYRLEVQAGRRDTLTNVIIGTGTTAVTTTTIANNTNWSAANFNPTGITIPSEGNLVFVVNAVDSDAVLGYAKLASASAVMPDTFSPIPATLTFADGEFYAISVRSGNGSTTRYYKFEIYFGRVNTLRSISIGGEQVPMGGANATWGSVVAGIQMFVEDEEHADGPVTVEKVAAASVVSYVFLASRDAALPDEGDWLTDLNIDKNELTNDSLLGIRVVGANGRSTLYYKIVFDLNRKGIKLNVMEGWVTDRPASWWITGGNNPFNFAHNEVQNQGKVYRFPADTFPEGKTIANYEALEIQWTVTGGVDPFRLNMGWNFTTGTGDLLWESPTGNGTRRQQTNRNNIRILTSDAGNTANQANIAGFSWQRNGTAMGGGPDVQGNGWTLTITNMFLVEKE